MLNYSVTDSPVWIMLVHNESEPGYKQRFSMSLVGHFCFSCPGKICWRKISTLTGWAPNMLQWDQTKICLKSVQCHLQSSNMDSPQPAAYEQSKRNLKPLHFCIKWCRSLSETSAIQSTIFRATAKYAYLSVTAKKLQTASAGFPVQEPKEMKAQTVQNSIHCAAAACTSLSMKSSVREATLSAGVKFGASCLQFPFHEKYAN